MIETARSEPSPYQVASVLLPAHLAIYRQERLAGVLEVTVSAGQGLGLPAYVGAIMWDAASDAWFLTALYDTAARPVDLAPLGLPQGPFRWAVPPAGGLQRLDATFGEAWGADACGEIEWELGATHAVVFPVRGELGARGAVIALLPLGPQTPAFAGLVSHAATAAAQCLDHEVMVDATAGVLRPHEFLLRAGRELDRATRYHRPLSLIVFEVLRPADLVQFGPRLARSLRRWDIVGRIQGDLTGLCVALPDSGRGEARGLLDRLTNLPGGVRIGAVVFPEDGANLEALIELGRSRATDVALTREGLTAEPPSTQVWLRGGLGRAGVETVRCPRCEATYTLDLADGAAMHLPDALCTRIRAVLQVACPRHPDRVTLEPEGAGSPCGWLGRVMPRRRVEPGQA